MIGLIVIFFTILYTLFLIVMIRKGLLLWYEKWAAIIAILGGVLVSFIINSAYPMVASMTAILILFTLTALCGTEPDMVFIYPVRLPPDQVDNLAVYCTIGKYKGQTVLVAETVEENLRLLDILMDYYIQTEQHIVPAHQVKIVSKPTVSV